MSTRGLFAKYPGLTKNPTNFPCMYFPASINFFCKILICVLLDLCFVNKKMQAQNKISNSSFPNTTFSKNADFNDAIFSNSADFTQAKFLKEARFERTTFAKDASFFGVIFSDKADFFVASFLYCGCILFPVYGCYVFY